MRFLISVAAVFLAGSVLPVSAQDTVREKVRLRYGDAAGIIKALPEEKRPSGVTELTAHLEDNSLLVRGTARGLAELNALIQRLDKQIKGVRLAIRVTRFDFDSNGIANTEIVGKPTVTTLDNMPATIGVHNTKT